MPKSQVLKPVQAVFAGNLYRLRIERQLTQEALAEKAELHPVYISGCERGERNVTITCLSKIADALGVSMGDLLDRNEHVAPAPGTKVYANKLKPTGPSPALR